MSKIISLYCDLPVARFNRGFNSVEVWTVLGMTRILCNESRGHIDLALDPATALDLAQKLIRSAKQSMSEHEIALTVIHLLQEEKHE